MRGDAAPRVVMVIFGTDCGFGLVGIIFMSTPAHLAAFSCALLLRNTTAHEISLRLFTNGRTRIV